MRSCEAIWAKAFVKSRSLIHAVVRCNEKFLIRDSELFNRGNFYSFLFGSTLS